MPLTTIPATARAPRNTTPATRRPRRAHPGERVRTDIRQPLSRALPHWLARYIDLPDIAAHGFGASQYLDVSRGHIAWRALHTLKQKSKPVHSVSTDEPHTGIATFVLM
ncbi:hypothetical protein B0E47_15900 [Rhodanobacter sp. B05]|jgi:hypothetical protein|uniref:hypothetical protein n=1 Tax=Rhodanobacter sp. B05 TaxID=1945859 RepID=UPI00098742FA|nr:hypothetical protein [Rhodanobacter sp. B05]OOG52751.1 hypothetical protein B0E47_15900 [Rhodanobacter sp. B05]